MKVAIASFGGPQSFGSVSGTVVFTQASMRSYVEVKVFLSNVSQGLHGMHVHQKRLTPAMIRNFGKDCCKQLGGHFNGNKPLWSPDDPHGTKHGNHVGDLNFNVKANNRNEVVNTFIDRKISLYCISPNCIIGKSLVVHKNEDDRGKGKNTESLITGNAGARIGCANIISIM